jgi:polyhydroxyalkanoate synthesis regulator phasin
MSRKSNISDIKRINIAKWCERHSDIHDIRKKAAEHFKVSINQVDYARDLYRKRKIGEINRDNNKIYIDELKKRLKDKSSTEIIKDLVTDLTVEVKATDMSIESKIKIIKDITSTIKQLQSADLLSQIKNPDVERIAIMMRFIKPSLTNDDIIELWKKADETFRSES